MTARSTPTREIGYFVLGGTTGPWLVARVRWPDVYQAISVAEPDWRSDPGLFDLPYDPSSIAVSYEEAAAIARDWGAVVPLVDQGALPGPVLIRRMPSNWSELSPAARRAWSIERTRAQDTTHASSRRRRRRRRRAADPRASDANATETAVVLDTELPQLIDLTESPVIDLTDTSAQTDPATKGEDS